MRLAFLGVCPDILDLLGAAAAEGHSIEWYVDAPSRYRIDAPELSRVKLYPEEAWEALLDAADIQGTVLGPAEEATVELRSEQWRRLTQAGSPLLVVHPVLDSFLLYLEIDMLAREGAAPLVPYFRDYYAASTRELLKWFPPSGTTTAVPPWDRISFSRQLEDRSPHNVFRSFARDAVLLDLTAGPFEQLVALGADASPASYANLAVQLHGSRQLPVRWEVAPARDEEAGMLTAVGTHGDQQLAWAAGRPQATSLADLARDPAPEAVAALRALAESIGVADGPEAEWARAVRAMELADSIDLSLQKGRKIEVYYRQMTEETSYKGIMSTAGCVLLLLAPCVLGAAGIAHAVFGWRLARFWYIPVLAIFVAFLVLQLLAWLMVRESDGGPPQDRHPMLDGD